MRISSGSSHVNLAHDCRRAMPARRLPHQQLERVAPQAWSLRQRSGAAAAADGEDAASAMGAPRAWRRGAPKALEAARGRKVTGRKSGILYWIYLHLELAARREQCVTVRLLAGGESLVLPVS